MGIMMTRRRLGLLAAGLAVSRTVKAEGSFQPPAGACDCHVHIIGPQDRYPMIPSRAYTPGESTVEELLALRRRLGLARTVLIQPSFYGIDNSALLDALTALGNSARGIAVLSPDVTDAELRALDTRGIRGVRVNIESAAGRDPREVTEKLAAFGQRIAPLGWHIQVFAALAVIARIADDVAALPVPVVFDHFGMPEAALGPEQPGFPVLLDLLRSGKAYVKLSAPYRISHRAPDYPDVAPIARALIEAGPECLVWASDWPHTDRKLGAAPTEISPFRAVDDAATLRLLPDWCPDVGVRRTILTDTPQRLYRFE
jgi:predicted TIM-barrel fold metal-dependent hydrolase